MAEYYWSRRLLLTLWQSTLLEIQEQKEEIGSELAYSILEQKMFNLSSTPGQAKPTDQYFYKT
jgi:hypothetical protein